MSRFSRSTAGCRRIADRFDQPAVGDTVYAVGAPLDPTYSATVSKGIISAFRDIEGEQWIQSDVNVQHGSSGGPLLDERGNVLGITSRGEPNEADAPERRQSIRPDRGCVEAFGVQPDGGDVLIAGPAAREFLCYVSVDQGDEPLTPKAREMAAMDDADGEGAQAFHAADIVVDHIVDQWAVIDRVAGEECPGCRLP